VINVKEGFRVVTIGMVEKIIENRFGSTAARLFRLIRRTGYMEQDKLTQQAMLSTKMGRSMLYKLVDANIVSIKEIRKTYTIASSLTNKVVAFLFYIDFDAVSYLREFRLKKKQLESNSPIRRNVTITLQFNPFRYFAQFWRILIKPPSMLGSGLTPRRRSTSDSWRKRTG